MHRRSLEEWIDFFFTTHFWQGEPRLMEPEKCDDLQWFRLTHLPKNVVPYVGVAVEQYLQGVSFSVFGWD